MNLNLGIKLDEETKNQVVSTSITRTETNCEVLKKINYCKLTKLENCCVFTNCDDIFCKTISKTDKKCMNGKTVQNGEYSKVLDDEIRNYQFDITETEEQLQRFLKIEHNTMDLAMENKQLKKMMEYLEKNYGNQFDSQRLNILDLKLQVEDLQHQLEVSTKHLDMKCNENEDLYKALKERKVAFEDLHNRFKQKDREAENLKARLEAFERDRLLQETEKKNMQKKMDDQLKEYELRADKLKVSLSDLNVFVMSLQKDKRSLNKLVYENQEKLSDYNKQIDNMRVAMEEKEKEAASRYDPDRKHHKELKEKELKGKNTELRNLKQDLRNANREIDNLRCENGDHKAEVERRKDDIEFLEKQLDRQKHENGKNADKIKELDNLITCLRNQLLEKQSEFNKERIETDIMKSKGKIGEAILKVLTKENVAKDKEIKRLKAGIEALNRQLEAKQSAMDDLRRGKNRNMGDAQKTELRVIELENEVDMKNKLLDDLTLRIKKLVDENEDMYGKVIELENDLEKQRKKNGDFAKSMNMSSTRLRSVSKRDRDYEDFKTRMDKILAEREDLYEQKKLMEDKIKELELDKDRIQRRYDELNANYDDIIRNKAGREKEFKKNKDSLDFLQSQHQDLEKRFNEALLENQKLRNDLAESNNSASALDKKHVQLQKDYKDVLDELAKQKNEIQKLKEANYKLKQDHMTAVLEAEDKIKKFTELKIEIERVKNDDTKDKDLQAERAKADKLITEIKEKEIELSVTIQKLDELQIKEKKQQKVFQDLKITIEKTTEELIVSHQKTDLLFTVIADIFSTVFKVRKQNIDIYEILYEVEPQTVNEKDLFETKRDDMLHKILEYLTDIDNNNREIEDEAINKKNLLNNIIVEKSKMQEELHDVREKIADLTKRHDIKTEQIGKLTAKVFLLTNGLDFIDKLNHNK